MRCVRDVFRLDSRVVLMDSLYLLIPLSVLIVLGIGAVLVWSVMSGQFEDIEREGGRVLDDDEEPQRR